MELKKVEEMRRKQKREPRIAKIMDTVKGVGMQDRELGKTNGEKNEKKNQDFSKLRQQEFYNRAEAKGTQIASEGYNGEKHYLRGQLGAGKARSENGYFNTSRYGEFSTNNFPFAGRLTSSRIRARNEDGKKKLFLEEKGKNKASSLHGIKKKNHHLLQKGITIQEPSNPVPDSMSSSDESHFPPVQKKFLYVGSPSSKRRAGKQEGKMLRAHSEDAIPKKRPHEFFEKTL